MGKRKARLPTNKDIRLIEDFLGWIDDLYQMEDLGLIAIDEELRDNYQRIAGKWQKAIAFCDLAIENAKLEDK